MSGSSLLRAAGAARQLRSGCRFRRPAYRAEALKRCRHCAPAAWPRRCTAMVTPPGRNNAPLRFIQPPSDVQAATKLTPLSPPRRRRRCRRRTQHRILHRRTSRRTRNSGSATAASHLWAHAESGAATVGPLQLAARLPQRRNCAERALGQPAGAPEFNGQAAADRAALWTRPPRRPAASCFSAALASPRPTQLRAATYAPRRSCVSATCCRPAGCGGGGYTSAANREPAATGARVVLAWLHGVQPCVRTLTQCNVVP